LAFFREKGIDVEVEPSGSRGPDIQGKNRDLVGEVKHEKELFRDLHCKYWTDWNSTRQKFGGETCAYRLAEHVPVGFDRLGERAKGWVALISGQLYYTTRAAKLNAGWIVYENYFSFEASLMEAVSFLIRRSFLKANWPEHRKNVGFLRVAYVTQKE
jgi:hypothetical protein